MNIPLNGRIAIVDDVYEQAEPLMRILSKNQMPYTFYKGVDSRFLPEINERYNDIRLLFLDINLIDDKAVPNEKQMRSALIFALERILSPDNFPYSIIFWSRHQTEHSALIEDIFNNELNDRKPIIYKGFAKSDFFPNFSTDEVENSIDLISEIEKIIFEQEAYYLLLQWENHIHLSADSTLQNIFSSYHESEWDNNANYTLNKLGEAYLGKRYKTADIKEKIKGSFISLSTVFKDILEHNIQNQTVENKDSLEYTEDAVIKSINSLNLSLNTSNYVNQITESGNILEFKEKDTVFKEMLNKIISLFGIKNGIKDSKPDISELILKKEASNEHKRIKDEIKKNWLKVCVVVTPICDFAQNNKVYDRIVKGLLIPKEYVTYIEDKSEAVFTIPFVIEVNKLEYYLVIDFRYFVTCNLTEEESKGNVTRLFRIRQELLSEIQSKLARHINRQGILLIDER